MCLTLLHGSIHPTFSKYIFFPNHCQCQDANFESFSIGLVLYALLTQIVTGHSYFRAHMWYMCPEVVIDIECQICGTEPETPWTHL